MFPATLISPPFDRIQRGGGIASFAATGAFSLTPLAGQGAVVTSTSSNAWTVGANGSTNPVLQVDANTGSVATGLKITGSAAASRLLLAVISSGTNEGLSIDSKGSGTIRLNATGTGAVEFSRNAVPTTTDGSALGTASLMWSDVFLASGAVINFDNGDVMLTHSANTLAFTGASSGYTFDALVLTVATAAGGAGLRLPHGTAPTSPTNGDVWTTTGGMYARINGVTALFTTSAVSDVIVVTTQAGNYTVLTTDNLVIVSGTFTITLPTAVGVTGKPYTVKKTDSGTTTTIATTASQTIDGATTRTILVQYESVTMVSDGSNWHVV